MDVHGKDPERHWVKDDLRVPHGADAHVGDRRCLSGHRGWVCGGEEEERREEERRGGERRGREEERDRKRRGIGEEKREERRRVESVLVLIDCIA